MKLIMPWNNLGCLGVKSADGKFYADLFVNTWRGWRPVLRAFVHDEVTGARRWYTLTWGGWELDKVQATDAEAFRRVCRRTMKPYAVVKDAYSWLEVECISYPFVEDGRAQVMTRAVGDEGGWCRAADCDQLRPIQFGPRCTGVPANDPLVCLERRAS